MIVAPGKVLLEAQDVGDLGAAPRIDRLVVVADAAEVAARLGEQPQPFVLALVGVLIFVDEDVAEAVAIGFEHVGVGAEDHQHVQQQVAEVAGVQRLQPLLILGVKFGAAAGGEGFGLAGVDLAGSPAAVLPAVDQPGELARGPALLVEVGGLDQLLEHAQLVVGVEDREVGLEPDQLGVAAQHPRRDRVEGAEPRHAFDRAAGEWPTRSRISRAALLVKVTARIWLGQALRVAIRWARRAVSAAVLPVPAPASTSTGPSVVSTASRWGGFRPCR